MRKNILILLTLTLSLTGAAFADAEVAQEGDEGQQENALVVTEEGEEVVKNPLLAVSEDEGDDEIIRVPAPLLAADDTQEDEVKASLIA